MSEQEIKIQENIPTSELRQDIVTGDFVVIATGRAKRPHEFVVVKHAVENNDTDPFSDEEAKNQEQDILVYRLPDGEWSLRVFPNKYPAFSRGKVAKKIIEGPYSGITGAGYHELIVTRDPKKPLALLPLWQCAEVLDAYQDRYIALMKKKSVNYIQIFHNHGKEAGASIVHPHSQLMAVPVISPYINLELSGAEKYYHQNKRNVYSVMVDFERETKKRIVFENEYFVAFCPYASRVAFEIWIVGKRHNPYFERITAEEKMALAEVMQKALFTIYQGLGDPAHNFYIHTAPCDGKDYPHYQWHIEILPHTAVWAGFELSTGIEVSTIEPEVAAEYLRGQINN